MRILALWIAVGAAMLAQEPPRNPPAAVAAPKAPARVDQALRSRVQLFFQAHVDGKLRLADQVVAQDTKDLFFAMQKPRYLSFEIDKIDYSDHFRRARVTVNCEEEVMMMGAGRMKFKMPQFSDWKLEHGKWYWYVDQNAVRETPFGPVKPVYKAGAGDSSSTPFVLPRGPTQAELVQLVTADQAEVLLSNTEPSSAVVTITNGVPGWITLAVAVPPLPGFEVTLDEKDIKRGQQAHVTIRYAPKDTTPPPSVAFNVSVDPIGALIPIRVTFGPLAPAKDKPPQ
jgi:hypothetical protein